MSDLALSDPRLRITEPDGETFAVGRLPGHGLLTRGEPYLAIDCDQDRCSTNIGGTTHQENGTGYNSVRGAGHAVCGCGALSPHLHYGSERRWWHRFHKARVILGQPEPAGQPTPVAAAAVA